MIFLVNKLEEKEAKKISENRIKLLIFEFSFLPNVLSFDRFTRRFDIETLVNRNCSIKQLTTELVEKSKVKS